MEALKLLVLLIVVSCATARSHSEEVELYGDDYNSERSVKRFVRPATFNKIPELPMSYHPMLNVRASKSYQILSRRFGLAADNDFDSETRKTMLGSRNKELKAKTEETMEPAPLEQESTDEKSDGTEKKSVMPSFKRVVPNFKNKFGARLRTNEGEENHRESSVGSTRGSFSHFSRDSAPPTDNTQSIERSDPDISDKQRKRLSSMRKAFRKHRLRLRNKDTVDGNNKDSDTENENEPNAVEENKFYKNTNVEVTTPSDQSTSRSLPQFPRRTNAFEGFKRKYPTNRQEQISDSSNKINELTTEGPKIVHLQPDIVVEDDRNHQPFAPVPNDNRRKDNRIPHIRPQFSIEENSNRQEENEYPQHRSDDFGGHVSQFAYESIEENKENIIPNIYATPSGKGDEGPSGFSSTSNWYPNKKSEDETQPPELQYGEFKPPMDPNSKTDSSDNTNRRFSYSEPSDHGEDVAKPNYPFRPNFANNNENSEDTKRVDENSMRQFGNEFQSKNEQKHWRNNDRQKPSSGFNNFGKGDDGKHQWAFDPDWKHDSENINEITVTTEVVPNPTKVPGSPHIVTKDQFPYTFWRPKGEPQDVTKIYGDKRRGQENQQSRQHPIDRMRPHGEVHHNLFSAGAGPITVPVDLVENTYGYVTAAPSEDLRNNPFEEQQNFQQFPDVQVSVMPFDKDDNERPVPIPNRHRERNDKLGDRPPGFGFMNGIGNVFRGRPGNQVFSEQNEVAPNHPFHRAQNERFPHRRPEHHVNIEQNEVAPNRPFQRQGNERFPPRRPEHHVNNEQNEVASDHPFARPPNERFPHRRPEHHVNNEHNEVAPDHPFPRPPNERFPHRRPQHHVNNEQNEVAPNHQFQRPPNERFPPHRPEHPGIDNNHRENDPLTTPPGSPSGFTQFSKDHLVEHVPRVRPPKPSLRHNEQRAPIEIQHPLGNNFQINEVHENIKILPIPDMSNPGRFRNPHRRAQRPRRPFHRRQRPFNKPPYNPETIKPINPHERNFQPPRPAERTHFDVKHNSQRREDNLHVQENQNRQEQHEQMVVIEKQFGDMPEGSFVNPELQVLERSEHTNVYHLPPTRPHPLENNKRTRRPINRQDSQQSFWSSLSNFDFSSLNPFSSNGYNEADYNVERLDPVSTIPASLLVPGGLAAVGAGLGLFYFNFVWSPTPIVRARLGDMILESSRAFSLTDDQEKAISEVSKVYSALTEMTTKFGSSNESLSFLQHKESSSEDDKEKDEILSHDCKNRLVCQAYSEFDDLLEVTKTATVLLGESLKRLDQELLLEYFLAADRGHHASPSRKDLQDANSCEVYYPKCPLPHVSVKTFLRGMVGIEENNVGNHVSHEDGRSIDSPATT